MMDWSLRLLLLLAAVLTLAYFLVKIRKNRLQIDFAIFWSLFSGLLVVIAIFPGIVSFAAKQIGIVSPANLVFLAIIFMLILRLFSLTVKLSKMNEQINTLAQHIAIKEKDEDK